MNPLLITVFLLGLLVGGALVWLGYGRDWQQRYLQAEAAAVAKEKQIKRQQQQIQEDMAAMTAQMRHVRTESLVWQQDMASAEVAISDLQNKLKRARSQANTAQSENHDLRHRLISLEAESRQWQENWQKIRQRTDRLRTQNEQLMQKLGGLSVELKQYQKSTRQTTPGADNNGNTERAETAVLVAGLKEQIATLLQQVEALERARRELSRTKQNLATAEEEIRHLQDMIANEMNPDEALPVAMTLAPAHDSTIAVVETTDNLRRISGIGPAFEKRLHAAGITTFSALVALPPATLIDIVDSRTADVESWIAQAKSFM